MLILKLGKENLVQFTSFMTAGAKVNMKKVAWVEIPQSIEVVRLTYLLPQYLILCIMMLGHSVLGVESREINVSGFV